MYETYSAPIMQQRSVFATATRVILGILPVISQAAAVIHQQLVVAARLHATQPFKPLHSALQVLWVVMTPS